MKQLPKKMKKSSKVLYCTLFLDHISTSLDDFFTHKKDYFVILQP